MATGFIQLPPDSTGKKLSTQTDAAGSHMEVHVLADSDGTLAQVSTLAKGQDNVLTGTLTAADAGSTTASGQGGQSLITGTATTGSTVSLAFPVTSGAPQSQSNFVIQVSGTFVGTYAFERSADNGVTWTAVGAFIAGTQLNTSRGTLPGVFHGNVAGTTHLRVRCTAFTSGSMSVRINSGIGTGTITLGAISPAATVGKPAERYVRTTGNAFFASSGNQTLAVAGNLRATFSNPSGNSRSCYIFKIQAWASSSVMAHLYVNPTTGLPATTKTVNKINLGSSASTTVTVSADTSTTTALAGGTDSGLDIPVTTGSVQPMELDPFVIPPGITVGFNIPFTGAGNGVLTIYWYEE